MTRRDDSRYAVDLLDGLAGQHLGKEAQDIVLDRIQLILDSKGLDHDDLAAGIKRSKGAVSLWFNRKRKIDLPTLDAIATWLGVDTYELLIDSPVPPRPREGASAQQQAEDALRTLMHQAGIPMRLVRDKRDS